MPLRSIVDYTQTIGYKISWELADILQPLVGKTTPCSKFTGIGERNDKDKSRRRRTDVLSLFTKTPIKEACEIIRKRLENDKTVQKRTNLSVDNMMEQLTSILWTA